MPRNTQESQQQWLPVSHVANLRLLVWRRDGSNGSSVPCALRVQVPRIVEEGGGIIWPITFRRGGQFQRARIASANCRPGTPLLSQWLRRRLEPQRFRPHVCPHYKEIGLPQAFRHRPPVRYRDDRLYESRYRLHAGT
jgi:hypothetical protein